MYRDSPGVNFVLFGLVGCNSKSRCGVFCGNFFRQAWCDLGFNWALLSVKCVGGCMDHVLVIGCPLAHPVGPLWNPWETALRISSYPMIIMAREDTLQCNISWGGVSGRDAAQRGSRDSTGAHESAKPEVGNEMPWMLNPV
ncbi:hypothetical protein AOQ84DRAFT_81575 [Glonium stellatum]|uniref:Uncharacterized protein n=1 Tax=Glonium stellatum TaxID=574774 RepID=A0A8E2EWP6_9PEZI|nr:hypothetical protein AOQ84DRAFT_81575 [Glonium stellatum]